MRRKLHIRWWLAVGIGLACVLAPACSGTGTPGKGASPASPRAAAAVPGAGSTPKAAAQPQAAEAAPGRQPAAGEPRRHPFASVLDGDVRRATVATRTGALVLKVIVGRQGQRTAIVQEGRKTHFVREGERIGGLSVLSIREGEVVLGAGARKRVLSLYSGQYD